MAVTCLYAFGWTIRAEQNVQKLLNNINSLTYITNKQPLMKLKGYTTMRHDPPTVSHGQIESMDLKDCHEFTVNKLQSCRKCDIYGNTIILNVKKAEWQKCDCWKSEVKCDGRTGRGRRAKEHREHSVHSQKCVHVLLSLSQVYETYVWGAVWYLPCGWF